MAASFHALVGGWASIAVLLLLLWRKRSVVLDGRRWLAALPIYAVTSVFALTAVLTQVLRPVETSDISPSYIFGTMHIRHSSAFQNLEIVKEKINECNVFATVSLAKCILFHFDLPRMSYFIRKLYFVAQLMGLDGSYLTLLGPILASPTSGLTPSTLGPTAITSPANSSPGV